MRPAAPPKLRNCRAFTLIEVLIVMVLMALLTAAAMTTINYAIRDDDARTETRRIAALIRLAAEEALLTGREYGLRLENGQLRFYIFEDDAGQWQPLDEDDTFRPRSLPESLDLDLVLEGQSIVLGGQADQDTDEADDNDNPQQPQLMFLSSGEITPFTLTVSESGPDAVRWRIEGDLLGRLELTELAQ